MKTSMQRIARVAISLFLGVLFLGVLASPPGLAQERSDRGDRGDRGERAEMTANQISDRVDARIAVLKAELRLTPDEDKNWPNVAAVLHDIGIKSAERRMSMRADRDKGERSAALVDDMRKTADFHSQRAEELRKLADAIEPFYATLDEQQRRRFVGYLRQNDRDR